MLRETGPPNGWNCRAREGRLWAREDVCGRGKMFVGKGGTIVGKEIAQGNSARK